MGDLEYVELFHDCQRPSTEHLPTYGHRHQVLARWRCPECGQRWSYEAAFLHQDRLYWERKGGPSRRWHKAETLRLNALSAAHIDGQVES